MKQREEYQARISAHFLTALMYADESGLNKEDKKHLTEWLSQWDGAVDVCLEMPEVLDETYDEPYFGRDDISGLMSNVFDCIVIVTKGA